MNHEICKNCKRYGGLTKRSDDKWLCAKAIVLVGSEVIPHHMFYERDEFSVIREQRKEPPEWCEYGLEQTLAEPQDDVEGMRKDKLLVYDAKVNTVSRKERMRHRKTYKGKKQDV
jgi:hypothetical protein